MGRKSMGESQNTLIEKCHSRLSCHSREGGNPSSLVGQLRVTSACKTKDEFND